MVTFQFSSEWLVRRWAFHECSDVARARGHLVRPTRSTTTDAKRSNLESWILATHLLPSHVRGECVRAPDAKLARSRSFFGMKIDRKWPRMSLLTLLLHARRPWIRPISGGGCCSRCQIVWRLAVRSKLVSNGASIECENIRSCSSYTL